MPEILAIVGISGKQRAGKDTLSDFFTEGFKDGNSLLPGFKRFGLADALKEEYCRINDLSLARLEYLKATDPTFREGLIALGRQRREQDPNYWVNKVLSSGYPLIVVPDLRFYNEAEAFREAARSVTLIRIEAERDVREERGALSNEDDPSEVELDEYEGFDIFLSNNSSLQEFHDAHARPASVKILKDLSVSLLNVGVEENLLDLYTGQDEEDLIA